MMNDLSSIVGIVVLLAAVAVSRIISERALRRLSVDEKVLFLDSFSNMRAYGTVPILLVFIGLFVLQDHISGLRSLLLPSIVVLLIALQTFVVWKLWRLSLPDAYKRTFLVSRVIIVAAFVLFVVVNMIGANN